MNEKSLTVFGNYHGKRQFAYAKDVARAAVNTLAVPNLTGIFNIGMFKSYSFMELASTINTVFNNDAGIEHKPEISADQKIYEMDINLAVNTLGWKPKFNLIDTYYDIRQELKGQ